MEGEKEEKGSLPSKKIIMGGKPSERYKTTHVHLQECNFHTDHPAEPNLRKWGETLDA